MVPVKSAGLEICFMCPRYENALKFRNKMANVTHSDLFSNPGTRLNLNW